MDPLDLPKETQGAGTFLSTTITYTYKSSKHLKVIVHLNFSKQLTSCHYLVPNCNYPYKKFPFM